MNLRIERTYHLDASVPGKTNDEVIRQATEYATGLLVEQELIVEVVIDGVSVNDEGIVRFTGPRSQLEQLIERLIDGQDPTDSFYDTSDEEMQRTLAGR